MKKQTIKGNTINMFGKRKDREISKEIEEKSKNILRFSNLMEIKEFWNKYRNSSRINFVFYKLNIN